MEILSLGFILLAGLASGKIIRRLKFPVVTAYLLLGILAGPFVWNLISPSILRASGLISFIVLGFVAFSLGQNFSFESFRKIGKSIIWISILGACGPWLIVTLGLSLIFKMPFYEALLYGAIASATAPAATVLVTREFKAKGTFTETLLATVAIDDAWCLIIFALSFAIARAMASYGFVNSVLIKAIASACVEIAGSFVLGWLIAWVSGYLIRFARTQAELLVFILGIILLNTGLAIYFGLSVLLANMFLGAVLVNIHHLSFKFFDTLRNIDPPLYIIFFVLAGANLEVNLLPALGALGIAYFVLRSFGKIFGAGLGGFIAGAPARIRNNIGLALLPQAGVALGVALVAKSEFPQIGGVIFSTIVATTVLYEIIGPICTKFALSKAGEI